MMWAKMAFFKEIWRSIFRRCVAWAAIMMAGSQGVSSFHNNLWPRFSACLLLQDMATSPMPHAWKNQMSTWSGA